MSKGTPQITKQNQIISALKDTVQIASNSVPYPASIVRRDTKQSLLTREQNRWNDVYELSRIIRDSMKIYNHEKRRCI